MSPQEKPFGKIKCGSREKSILLLMLEYDKPRGTSIPLLAYIHDAFKINFDLIPKNRQHDKLRRENQFKCAIFRLTKRRYIQPVMLMDHDFCVRNPHGHGYTYYILTGQGRLVAEKIEQKQRQREQRLKDQSLFEEALSQFRALGYVWVMINQVREMLWQLSKQDYTNRVVFDSYWNNTKLGLLLKKCTTGQVRVGLNDRHLKYQISK